MSNVELEDFIVDFAGMGFINNTDIEYTLNINCPDFFLAEAID